jgi:hypothetical protein
MLLVGCGQNNQSARKSNPRPQHQTPVATVERQITRLDVALGQADNIINHQDCSNPDRIQVVAQRVADGAQDLRNAAALPALADRAPALQDAAAAADNAVKDLHTVFNAC